MLGNYVKGKTGCFQCNKEFRHKEHIIIVHEAEYDANEEVMDFVPYIEELYCKKCWEKKNAQV
jgi:hypothetical protein